MTRLMTEGRYLLTVLLLLAGPLGAHGAEPANGWLSFRWGMSVPDVERVLRSRNSEMKSPEALQSAGVGLGGRASSYRLLTEMRLANRQILARFDFLDGKLFRIVAVPTADGAFLTAPRDVQAWGDRVSDLLTRKHGKPTSETTNRRTWELPVTRVTLKYSGLPTLTHSDSKTEDRVQALLRGGP